MSETLTLSIAPISVSSYESQEDVIAPLDALFRDRGDRVALVYCATARQASLVFEKLQQRFSAEFAAPAEPLAEWAAFVGRSRLGYYAAVSSEPHRGETVKMFKAGYLRVVIATSAFGMYVSAAGVLASSIGSGGQRFVFHISILFDFGYGGVSGGYQWGG
jgi:superfamily II DNA helicase RecQ